MNPTFTERHARESQASFNAKRRGERQAWLLTRVLKLHQEGLGIRVIAQRLGVHRSRIEQLHQDLNLSPNTTRGVP